MTATIVPVILLAFANARDNYLRNLPEEARQVREALDVAEQHGRCQLVLRQNATAADILDVFQDVRYRDRIALFHFGGHADGYRLLLETAAGAPAAANAGGLARFLAQQRGLTLVFLNGCSTEGQVADLLAAGVPAVIATDQAVDDAQATAFAARFYRGLAGGATIAAAYEEAKAERQMADAPAFRHIGAAEEEPDADHLPWHLHVRSGAETASDWSLSLAAGDPLFGLPALPPLDLPDKPYRNLDWYRREDAPIFFGRGHKIRELYNCVTAASNPPIILFYGQSGVGKSSLLSAGLLPRLESSHVVRYARRDQAVGLLGTLAAALGAAPDADLPAAWRALETQAGRPLLVVLDQVEEVFTRANKDQPDELAHLLTALGALFADAGGRPRGRLILSFRKEWLAELKERLAERHLPRGEVFLERLAREGIIEVVKSPQITPRLADYYRLAVTDPLPGLIADDLLADRESPVAPMLAILLAGMWEAAKARSYDRPAFDADLYHQFRSRGLSLDDFLGRQLRALHDKQPEVVVSGLALDLLAYHTTPLGTAEQRALADLEQTYSHRRDVLPGLVQECRDIYLLVDPAQNRPDQPPASRLTHDTLAPHVRKRFDESDAPGQRARRILESRAVDWQDVKSGAPLDGADLKWVENGLRGMRQTRSAEDRLMQASQGRRTRRRREQLGAFVVLLTLMSVVLWPAVQSTFLLNQAQQLDISVPVENFEIGQYEVSIAQYKRCVSSGHCERPDPYELYTDRAKQDVPVTNVDAFKALSYCRWLRKRLPSAKEWETAARRTYGNDVILTDDSVQPDLEINMLRPEPEQEMWPVRSAGPDVTTARIFHLIGNARELTMTVSDLEPETLWDGRNPTLRVAVVGGSFYSHIDRVTDRYPMYPDSEDVETGFRCASELHAK